MKNLFRVIFLSVCTLSMISLDAQALRIPGNTNFASSAGRRIGATEIEIHWNAPGVKGREGNIWGTNIAWYGFQVLGFGSNSASPWRAGADECTTISFSTDVMINGKPLAAGKYALFMALSSDTTTLIFNKNVGAWGSYFYDASMDVLRVNTFQQKNQPNSVERLAYTFSNQKDNSVEVALEWEKWRIPFTVSVDLKASVLADIKSQLSGAIGFDAPSLIAGAQWCLQNDVNHSEALTWITSATNPNFGNPPTFGALTVKAGLLEKLGNKAEADKTMEQAMPLATIMEMHQYGRQLLAQKKVDQAFAVFQKNYDKNKGAWPTNGGMMRGWSAKGDYKKALEYARIALTQAPDENNKNAIMGYIKTLESGKAL